MQNFAQCQDGSCTSSIILVASAPGCYETTKVYNLDHWGTQGGSNLCSEKRSDFSDWLNPSKKRNLQQTPQYFNSRPNLAVACPLGLNNTGESSTSGCLVIWAWANLRLMDFAVSVESLRITRRRWALSLAKVDWYHLLENLMLRAQPDTMQTLENRLFSIFFAMANLMLSGSFRSRIALCCGNGISALTISCFTRIGVLDQSLSYS